MNILNLNSTEKENSQTISKLFNSLDIKEYEPSTINCMNEFIKSYIKNILKDAKKNMILGKREKITIEDVESAVNRNQNNMYKNRSKISEMKFLADKVNSIDLPFIPESPVVLRPPINNSLLRNNFQIYSEELNKTLLNNISLKKDNEINIIGNKRKKSIDSKNYSNNKNIKKEKNKRKKSVSQELKNSLQQKNKAIEKSMSSNSLSKDDDDLSLDNNDENDDTNNNAGESTLNKKEEDNSDEDEYSEENENMNNNESNNNDNIGSSYSKNNNDED